MASPSCPFRTSDPFAARQHALRWAYASWQDAVILLDQGQLLVLIGPHKETLRGKRILGRITPLGKYRRT